MIKSPCTGICKLINNGKFCIGCGRSIEEISNWNNLKDKEKKEIIKKIQKKSSLKKSIKNKD